MLLARPHSGHRLLRATTVTKVCAVWLVVLAALPFTTPFATLDFSDFFGGGNRQRVIETIAAPAASSAQDDDADDAVASSACFQRIRPTALDGLAPVASPVASDAVASIDAIFSTAAVPSLAHVSTLVTTLRL